MSELGDKLREYADRIDAGQYAFAGNENSCAIVFAGEIGYILADVAKAGEEDRAVMHLGLKIYQATNMKPTGEPEFQQ